MLLTTFEMKYGKNKITYSHREIRMTAVVVQDIPHSLIQHGEERVQCT
jgi:hypothetical protein